MIVGSCIAILLSLELVLVKGSSATESCTAHQTQQGCTAAASSGCSWCGNSPSVKGFCYHESAASSCCQLPLGELPCNVEEQQPRLCNASQICMISNISMDPGSCYANACCAPDEVSCLGQCFPAGTQCCGGYIPGGWSAPVTCPADGTCCGEINWLQCCPSGTACSASGFQCQPIIHDCRGHQTEQGCTANASCLWCGNQSTSAPGGLCYHASEGDTCCAVPPGGNSGGTCENGNALVCNASQTCMISTHNTHYGPCFYPACCAPGEVSCQGQCYPAGTQCCSDVTCTADQQCCDDVFQGGVCCDKDATCCGEAWNLYCCPSGTTCNIAYSNCTEASLP